MIKIGECQERWEEVRTKFGFYWVYLDYRIVPGSRVPCASIVCERECEERVRISLGEVYEVIGPDGSEFDVNSGRGMAVISRLKEEFKKTYCPDCLQKYYLGI